MSPLSVSPILEVVVVVVRSLTPISGKTVTTTRSKIIMNRCTLHACEESGSSMDDIVCARASTEGPNKGLRIPNSVRK